MLNVLLAERSLEPVLTVIHAKYNGSPKKGTDGLEQEVHGKLPPALSSQQTQGEGDRGVQVAAWKCTASTVNISPRKCF